MNLLYECDAPGERRRHRPAIGQFLKTVLSGWWADRHNRAARRRSLVRLADLEQWQLEDIGLTRSEVDRVLERNGVARDPVSPFRPH